MERVLDNLSSHYMPFTLLSKERLSEVVNTVRFVELRKDEILQIRGGKGNDYLYVVEGRLEIVQCGSVHSFTSPRTPGTGHSFCPAHRRRPPLLPAKTPSSAMLTGRCSII